MISTLKPSEHEKQEKHEKESQQAGQSWVFLVFFVGFVFCIVAYPPAQRVAVVDKKFGLGRHVRGAGYAGMDSAILAAHATLKDAADDALLSPHVSGFELPIRHETGQFGASASAARRTIISLAWTEHKVLAVGTSRLPEKLALHNRLWRILSVVSVGDGQL